MFRVDSAPSGADNNVQNADPNFTRDHVDATFFTFLSNTVAGKDN